MTSNDLNCLNLDGKRRVLQCLDHLPQLLHHRLTAIAPQLSRGPVSHAPPFGSSPQRRLSKDLDAFRCMFHHMFHHIFETHFVTLFPCSFQKKKRKEEKEEKEEKRRERDLPIFRSSCGSPHRSCSWSCWRSADDHPGGTQTPGTRAQTCPGGRNRRSPKENPFFKLI